MDRARIAVEDGTPAARVSHRLRLHPLHHRVQLFWARQREHELEQLPESHLRKAQRESARAERESAQVERVVTDSAHA